MKNRILITALISTLLSFNAFAEDNVKFQLENLEEYFDQINEKGEVGGDKKTPPPSLPTEKVDSDDSIYIKEVMPVIDLSNNDEENKPETSTKPLSLGDGSFDKVFMKSIPEGTRFTVKKDFVLLPKQKYIIFHNGEKVIENPQNTNPLTTFCYMEFAPSGKARILKEGRLFTVTRNNTTLTTYQPNDNVSGEVKVYQSNLSVDIKSLRAFKCYKAAQKSKNPIPLRILDLRNQTGSSFEIEFPAYEEI